MGQLEVMDFSGDTKHMWDAHNEEEWKAAEQQFDRLKGKNFHAFYVKKDGSTGEPMKKFDRFAERVIMIPQLAGGGA